MSAVSQVELPAREPGARGGAPQSGSYQLLRILNQAGHKIGHTEFGGGELSSMANKDSRGHLRSLRTFSTFFMFFPAAQDQIPRLARVLGPKLPVTRTYQMR